MLKGRDGSGAFRHPERRKTSYVKETLIQSKSQCFPKRRGVLIVLRAVVISSVAERSFLHCGQYHIGTIRKRRLGAAHILCLSICKGRFLACARNDDTGVRGLLVTSHKSLAIRPCSQIFGVAISRIVIPSAAEGSFLHCGQYHIGTAGKRRLGATHILCLSVCMEDFSLTLEMTMRESSSH